MHVIRFRHFAAALVIGMLVLVNLGLLAIRSFT